MIPLSFDIAETIAATTSFRTFHAVMQNGLTTASAAAARAARDEGAAHPAIATLLERPRKVRLAAAYTRGMALQARPIVAVGVP